MEIVVCPGEDGEFVFYDDAGDGYGYERGECARVKLTWDDAARTLTIGDIAGAYPGMPREKSVTVRLIGGGGKSVVYCGERISVTL